MDPLERMEVYRNVRAILVRNYIDLGRVAIQIATGTVQLRGTLLRLMGSSPLSPEAVQGIVQEIRRVRGVRRVVTDFDNWTVGEDARTFQMKDERGAPAAPPSEVPCHDLSPETPPQDGQP